MIPSKDAKELLYKLFAEKFIALQVMPEISLQSLCLSLTCFKRSFTSVNRKSLELQTMPHPEHFTYFLWI